MDLVSIFYLYRIYDTVWILIIVDKWGMKILKKDDIGRGNFNCFNINALSRGTSFQGLIIKIQDGP